MYVIKLLEMEGWLTARVIFYRKKRVMKNQLKNKFYFYNAELHKILVWLKILAVSLDSKISILS